MTPNATRQAQHRARRSERLARMTLALTEIVAALDGNEKALSVKIRQIAEAALAS